MKNQNENRVPDDPRLTAYALGELEGTEHAEVEAILAASPDGAREVAEIRAMAGAMEGALGAEEGEQLRVARRIAVLGDAESSRQAAQTRPRSTWRRTAAVFATFATAAGVLGFVAVRLLPTSQDYGSFVYDISGDGSSALRGLGYESRYGPSRRPRPRRVVRDATTWNAYTHAYRREVRLRSARFAPHRRHAPMLLFARTPNTALRRDLGSRTESPDA